MAAVNRNMFDATVSTDIPSARGGTVMGLPLNILAQIISYVDNPADLARICRTCRVLNYMALPQLYRNVTLTSYDKIRYRGEEPEGWGGASPFSMGLNTMVTRPHAELVRSMTLRGEWREHELEEHARVGRVPDSMMMLNIAVRAAIDRMSELESFSWELNTKMLETIYHGLAQRPKLTSLTIRFPSSRHPRPTTVIPPMHNLRSLKITDIDPLCYPDDISTLLLHAKKLEELKLHWSPRMREVQEPSVMLHDYFRKCIAAKSPLKVKKLSLQNLYAIHTEEFNTAFDQSVVEDVTVLNSPGTDERIMMNSFVDNTWPAGPPPSANFRVKAMRHDHLSKKHCEFIARFSGLERLYFVNAVRNPSDYINTPRQSTVSSNALTPPTLEQAHTSPNGATATSAREGSVDSPQTPSNATNAHLLLRQSYLNAITANHGATLRHLLLPSRWPLSASAMARVVRGCPNIQQLAFAPESSSFDTLAVLLPFLRNLVALRLLITTEPQSSQGSNGASRSVRLSAGAPAGHGSNGIINHKRPPFQSLAEIVEMDDRVHQEMISTALADHELSISLKILGLGWKAFEIGDFYTIAATSAQDIPGFGQGLGAPVTGANLPSRIIPVDSPTLTNVSPAGTTKLDNESINISSTPTPFPNSPIPRPAKSTGPSPKSSLGKHPRDADSLPQLPDQKRQYALDFANSCGDLLAGTVLEPQGDKRLWRRRVRRVGWEVLQRWEIWSLDVQEI